MKDQIYILEFDSAKDNIFAITRLEAEDDLDAIAQTVERIKLRLERGVVGTHKLYSPDGRPLYEAGPGKAGR